MLIINKDINVKFINLYKKHTKLVYALGGVLAVLVITMFLFNGSVEGKDFDVKVYDTREIYVESPDNSTIYFEATMYDNPNLNAFSDFPVILRIDNTSSEDEAIELGEVVASRIKEEIDLHFPGEDYSVKTYVYHTQVNENGEFIWTTSKELLVVDSRE